MERILIVDDNPKNIQLLGSILSELDYEIEYAQDGSEAVEIVTSDDFDLILMDVMMPEMDGYEACKRIKKMENKSDIPLIFITAKTDIESITHGFDIGGVDYISKPFNSAELVSRVKTHIALKKSKDELDNMNILLEQKVRERTKELQNANEELAVLDDSKNEFLNIISHEIRTPLNGIIGPLSILSDYQLSEEVSSWMNVLDLSAKRLEDFSEKALNISQFNTKGKYTLNRIETNINKIISDQIIKLNKNIEDKTITVTMANETDKVLGLLDEKFMNDCFYYIIDNAVKFGNKDSQIIIKTTIEKGNIVVSVEDEGNPFPEDFNISTIQPFKTKNHVDQNPSLSLFLCKQIVEAHDGQIEISNTPKGAIVKVYLPKVEKN